MRTRSRRLLLGITVAAGALATAEVALRVAWGPPPPPVRVFSGLAPVERFWRVEGEDLVALYGSPGELAVERIPTTSAQPRVAWLGGSSMHGGTQGPTTEFPELVAAELGITPLNLARPALDSHDIVRMVEELLPWHFSAIVVYTGHNDFGNIWFNERYGDASSGASARLGAALEHLQLFVLLRRALSPWAGAANLRTGAPPRHPDVTSAQIGTALRYLEANLRRMAWLCRRADVPLVLVTPASAVTRKPSGPHCDPANCSTDLWKRAKELAASDPADATRLFRAARDADTVPIRPPTAAEDLVRTIGATEPGVILVDAERELPREGQLDLPAQALFQDVVHFSTPGHQAMANLLVPVVGRVATGEATR